MAFGRLRCAAMRLAAALVLLAALTVTASALAGPHDPTKRLTAADNARAQRGLIRAADLGTGWKTGAPMKDSDSGCAGFSPDESAFVQTGEASGPTLTHPSGSVITTGVDIFRTAAEVRRDWALVVQPGLLRCLTAAAKSASDANSQVSGVSAKRLPFPQIAPMTALYRVVMSISAGGRTMPFAMDFVLVGSGRYELTLMVAQLGRSVPRDAEVSLARLMLKRLQA
jgi:hypothetical protein